MNTSKLIGILFLVLGISMMIYTGFTYFTTKSVAVIGDLKINKTESHPVQWSPIVGLILVVVGIILLLIKKK
ncbi:hypothetical protein BH09BAC5_BH09BAC5_03100 [soil metagenome]